MRIPSSEQKNIPTKSVNIVTFDGNQKINFNDNALSKILLHPEVRDRTVVVIAISGAFRKGKSFLLDYLLRFMYKYVSTGTLTRLFCLKDCS